MKEKKRKPIKTSSRKAKGRRLQDSIGKCIARVLGLEFGSDKDVRPAIMGESGSDIRFSPLARSRWDFCNVECKYQESLSIWKALKQAEEHGDSKPILFFRRNNSKTYAVLEVNDFFDLMEELFEYRKKASSNK